MKHTSRILCMLLVLALALTLAPVLTRATEAETQEVPGLHLPQVEIIPAQVNPLYEGLVDGSYLPQPQLTWDLNTVDPNATTYLTADQAAAQLRTALVNREENVVLNVHHTSSSAQTVGEDLFARAMVHTGKPEEGDYLLWQYYNWGGQAKRTSSSDGYDYTMEITVTYYTSAEQEAEMDTAVAALLKELNVTNKSDYEKICAVYDYICANITYDYDNLEDDTYWLKHTAYAALINKTAVCQGYAVLFYRLMLELGVDNRLIAGIGYDASGNGGPHGWNIVELEGLYYNVDSTWDAGYTDYDFFLTNTWNFVGHARYLDYETMAFHNEYPMAAEDYTPGTQAVMDTWIYIGQCGDAAYWLLERDGTLTVLGEGAMYGYEAPPYSLEKQSPWQYWNADIRRVVVEEGITTVGLNAFFGCNAVTSVSLPETLTEIGYCAFKNCTALETVNLPSGLTKLGASCFYDCDGLKKVTIPAGVLSVNGFGACDNLEEVVFLGPVTEINTDAFADCPKLKDVKLPETVKVISERAFRGAAIETLTLPEGLTTIADAAFSGCPITTLTIPTTVTSLQGFSGCKQLKTVIFPDGLTAIGKNAFQGCSALETLNFPSSLKTIGENAFDSCTGLKTLDLHEGLTTIEADAFSNCDGLTEITIPSTVTRANGFSFCDGLVEVTISEGVISLVGFDYCSSLKTVHLPNTLEKIERYAFNQCSALEYIEIPGSVKTIETGAFEESGLVAVKLNEGLDTIEYQGFHHCHKLKSVTIPSTVTNLGGFYYCNGLESVYLYNGGVIANNAFEGCWNLKTIEFYGDVKKIGAQAFRGAAVEEVTIPASVTILDGFGETGLITVTIEGNVQLGDYAFSECDKLENVIFKGDVSRVGHRAFEETYALKELTFPAGVTSVESYAFWSSGLESVTFTGNAPEFDSAAFSGVTMTVYYPAGNPTWTSDVMQDYKGTITWVADESLHTHSTTLVPATEATCSAPGNIAYYTCSCGQWFEDAEATILILDHESVVIPMKDHSYGTWTVTKEPTCTESGSREHTCKVCGYVGTEVIPALGHDYVDGECTRCGERYRYVKFSSYTTSLGGNIAMNFYVDLSDDLLEEDDAVMQFTFAGRTVSVALKQGRLDDKGRYCYSCPITSKNMADPITAQVLVNGQPVGESKTMDVRTYCEWIIANNDNEKTIGLMKAMLNYGASAQLLFDYKTDDLANASLTEAEKVFAAVDASASLHSRTGEEAGITPKSYTLLLDSETTIRVYFELTGDKTIDQFTFTVDGVEVTPKQASDGRWYIECKNIAAHNLDQMHTFTLGGITIRYSGLSYVNQVMTYYTGGTTFDMASALYAYWQAAENYIAE